MVLLFIQSQFAYAQPEVESYDLGEAIIVQDQFPEDSRFHDMPVTLQGVLAVPDGEGPFPVVVFVHGVYEFCTAIPPEDEFDVYPCPPEHDLKPYEGFSYLAEALAEHGYITIVPDISAEFNNGYAEPQYGQRTLQMIEAHLNALMEGEGFGIETMGKADDSSISLVTHSRGGPLAITYINDETYATHDINALVLLTPAHLPIQAAIPENLPTALVFAECDGDVKLDEPSRYTDDDLVPLRPTLTSFYMIPGGIHSAFNTKLPPDDTHPCGDMRTLEPQIQQEFIESFVAGFLDLALADSLVQFNKN